MIGFLPSFLVGFSVREMLASMIPRLPDHALGSPQLSFRVPNFQLMITSLVCTPSAQFGQMVMYC